MKQWAPKEIEVFRKNHNLTRRALGELTGVTVSSVFQWERGLKRPSKTAQILLTRIEKEFKRKGVIK
jgi:DNA-binding transcriptional regulator YiaG